MNNGYEVGFKDVYPWVWSVMLGVALMLAERRGAFQSAGTRTKQEFWTKNLSAVVINVAVPAILFGLTMVRLGPRYSPNMDFWRILGVLYLAGSPLGAHHIWMVVATKYRWVAVEPHEESNTLQRVPENSVLWAALAFGVPALAALCGWRLPF